MVRTGCEPTEKLVERLSPRQHEVLQLLARGLTNHEIGDVLKISGETVRTHVGMVLSRLEVSNRTEAAAAYLAWDAAPERVGRVLARPAIAVLPIVTLGTFDQEAQAAIVACGLARDLVGLFSRWCCFPVIANVATYNARELGRTSQEIGERLGARFLIDVALRSSDTQWRISASIVDASSGCCVGTASHDFPRGALFEVQDQVCRSIVAVAYPRLLAAMRARLPRGNHASDLDAWELAHAALDLQSRRERDANVRARSGFDAALGRDPTLVLAHYGLGLAAYDEVLNQWGPEQPALDRLVACAERCIELAPQMAEGHYLIGRYYQARGMHGSAIAPLEQAIGHNPSFASAHALLGQALLIAGRSDEGILRVKHACRLGPRAFVAGLAAAHFVRGEYADALVAAEQVLAGFPQYPFALAVAAAGAFWTEDLERATARHRELLLVQPDFSPANFLRTFGPHVEAVARIAEALEAIPARRSPRGSV